MEFRRHTSKLTSTQLVIQTLTYNEKVMGSRESCKLVSVVPWHILVSAVTSELISMLSLLTIFLYLGTVNKCSLKARFH